MQHNILSGLQSSDTWSGKSATCCIFMYFFSSPANIFGRHGVFEYCIFMYFFSSSAAISGIWILHIYVFLLISYFILSPLFDFLYKGALLILLCEIVLSFVLKNKLRNWVVLHLDIYKRIENVWTFGSLFCF